MELPELTQRIIQWGEAKGILANSDAKSQYIKAVTELGELGDEVLSGTIEDVQDAIGDTYVCLTLLAELMGTDMKSCISRAYNEIANRTGVMKNGAFVCDRG